MRIVHPELFFNRAVVAPPDETIRKRDKRRTTPAARPQRYIRPKSTTSARRAAAAIAALNDQALADLIDSWTKRRIVEAYSHGECSEELAIALIRNGLVHA